MTRKGEIIYNRVSEGVFAPSCMDVATLPGGQGLPPSLFPPIMYRGPQLIGLTGKARSGKDTVAQMLKDAFNVETLAFAYPLKEGLKTMLNLTDEHVHGSLKETVIEDFGKSPRQMLQTLGTDWGRELVNNDLWLIVARRRIAGWLDEGKHVVMTDVRFDNEAELVRKLGGTVWHVRRNNAQAVNAHASEAGVTFVEGDKIIDNNGTLAELFDTVCDEF